MRRRLPALALALATLLASSAASAQDRELSAHGDLLDGIAAIVNDGIVLKSELRAEMDRIVRRLEAQGTRLPPERTLAPQVLERLVIARIELQRAERVGIQVSDETLNNALASIAQRNNVTLAELPQVLAREGMDYQAYRREMRDQIAIEQLRQRDVMARINVTPREIDEYLARQAGRAAENMEFDLSQILVSVSPTASPEAIATAEKRIGDIARRVKAGEDFAQLAVALSDGQQALEGGRMGWLKGNELPTVFADVVPGLAEGGVSEPIRSSSGFHLVRLNDQRGGEPVIEQQVHVRHILIAPNEVLDDDSAHEKIRAIRERLVGGEDFAATARAISDDPGSKNDGGDLGWAQPGIYAPEFKAMAEKLEPNVLSEPFRTAFGWHLMEVLGRRTQDTTEEVRRQQAALAIRNSKLGEETELWARRLRDQAFVEFRI
ncbi:MAG: peptidylprolyl isomerase [Gammaproteobacteria bacterium]|nr:peptidylprolyl isomerase [Gammaproteobacteria bacterium]